MVPAYPGYVREVIRRRKLLWALLVTLALFAAAEAGARLALRNAAMSSIPAEQVRQHISTANDFVYDPVLGWKRGKVPNPALGIESHGFRHAEVAQEKPAGVVRGFALGDSQTYGAGVEAGQDWPSVAEAFLQRAGLPVELINAGLSGYHSRQALRLIETQLLAFDPDFIVVDCRVRDDVRDRGEAAPMPGIAGLLFNSGLYRGMRLLVAQTRPQEMAGNHDLILELAQREGMELWFVDYPVLANPVNAEAPLRSLPMGARGIPASDALLRSGQRSDQLFFDNNHLTVEGNRIVGEMVGWTLKPTLERRARLR